MTSLDQIPLRDNLRGKKPYGAPHLHVPMELNVNENTYGIPAEVAEDIVNSVSEVVSTLNRYPDREFDELRTALGKYLKVPAEMVWAANGSNEVLQQILQAFGGPGRSLMSFTPTYSMYPILADGTQTDWIPVPRESDFTIDPVTAAATVREHKPDITILCGPNNPTGTGLDREVVKSVYAATDGIVIVDEAYQEFSGQPSVIDLLEGRPRLIVTRTMSKAFAFAGVRLGYLAADPVISDALRLVRLPYHLSAVTQAVALAALRHSGRMLANVAEIIHQRSLLVAAVTEIGFAPYASDANFVLVGGISDPEAVFDALLERGILVRNNGIPHTLRITVGTATETAAVISALRELAGYTIAEPANN